MGWSVPSETWMSLGQHLIYFLFVEDQFLGHQKYIRQCNVLQHLNKTILTSTYNNYEILHGPIPSLKKSKFSAVFFGLISTWFKKSIKYDCNYFVLKQKRKNCNGD